MEKGTNVIVNSRKRRVMKRGQKAAGLWWTSPAIFQFFVAALWLLEDLALQRGVDLGSASRVTKIRAARVKGEDSIFLYPTNWDDPEGIPLNRGKGKVTANLYEFMAEASLLLEIGHAELFHLVDAGPESPVGPAVKFDRSRPAERKTFSVEKKKSDEQAAKAKKSKAKAEQPKQEQEVAQTPQPDQKETA